MFYVKQGSVAIPIYRLKTGSFLVMWYEETEAGRIRRCKKFVRKDRAIAWTTGFLRTHYGNEADSVRTAKELSRAAASQLYLIRCGEHIKIGISSDSDSRLRQIQSSLPLQMELIATIQLNEAKKVERLLHAEFAPKRVRGEWFLLTEQDVDSIRSRYRA